MYQVPISNSLKVHLSFTKFNKIQILTALKNRVLVWRENLYEKNYTSTLCLHVTFYLSVFPVQSKRIQ